MDDDYLRGVSDGSTWAMERLIELVEGRAGQVEDADGEGPTWNALLGFLRDGLARVQEGGWQR